MPKPSKSTTKAKPKSTQKRSTASRSKKTHKRSFAMWLKWLALRLILVIVLISLAWLIVLDFQVRAKFDGKKWAIPARVYARPLEVYEGLLLTPEELLIELKSLGYRHVKKVYQPAQFERNGSRFTIYSRDFIFADKKEIASRYTVALANDNGQSVVTQLVGADDDLVLRLDPKEIGSIYPNDGEDRVLVALADTPPLLGETLIAVEDKNFANHYGISFSGIARAMIANIKAGRFVQGGSTLTQQLVKNFYLTQRKSLWRKIQEALMAPLLELHYTKAEILEAYINEVYLGQSGPRGIHGFGLASQHYFGRNLQNLQPDQIALLVAVVKGATYYNPWRNPERALARRNLVLQIMADNQLILPADAKKYSAKPLGVVAKSSASQGDYPAFLDIVKQQLRRDYRDEDLQSEGLRIFTTMSSSIQAITEASLSKRVDAINRVRPQNNLQAAAVITAVGSGEVLAAVGDRNPRYSGFNRVLRMRRPIGSLVKPFVYLAALKQSDHNTLATLIDDSPVSINLPNGTVWEPRNFSKESYGQIPLYEALAYSYNQSTARLGMATGLPSVIAMLEKAGAEEEISPLPSLLLGAIDLSPLEVSHLYHTLAADGVYTPLRTILNVVDADHQPLQRYPLASRPSISSELSYLIHYNLQAAIKIGTGKRATQQLPKNLMVAGKTGTTNRQRDSWFAGYSGDHLGVVWLGNDDNSPTAYTGSSGPLPIWSDVFANISTRSISYQQPSNIEYYWVDSVDGLLSAEQCDNAILMPFIKGTQPAKTTECIYATAPISRWFEGWFNRDASDNSGSSENESWEDDSNN